MRSPALILLALTLVCSPLLTACKSASGGSAMPVGIKNVPILDKASGDQVDVSNYMLAVIDEGQFNSLGLNETSLKPDFASQSVVLFCLGEQNSSGFAADIVAIQREGGELYVQGTAKAPAAADASASVMTYPFCAVVIDKVPAGTQVRSDITSLE